jgi:hypothetical protein
MVTADQKMREQAVPVTLTGCPLEPDVCVSPSE